MQHVCVILAFVYGGIIELRLKKKRISFTFLFLVDHKKMIWPTYCMFAWTLTNMGGPEISGHSTAVVNKNLYLFGGLLGSAGSDVSNRFWKYNGIWQEMNSTPSKRMYAAAAELDDNFYVFGGWDPGEKGSGGTFKDDVWKFDTIKNEWTELDTMPDPVSRHCACRVGSKIVVSTFRNTLVYENDTLKEQPTTGESPNGLSMCTCTALGDEFIVFGGATKTQDMTNDVFVLNSKTWEWRKQSSEGDIPTARASSAACVLNTTTCLVYGGGGINSAYKVGKGLYGFNDLYALRIDDDRAIWTKLKESTNGGRVASSLDLVNNVAVLHGGWNPQTKETYESTHAIVL